MGSIPTLSTIFPIFITPMTPTFDSTCTSNLGTGALTNPLGQHTQNNQWIYDPHPFGRLFLRQPLFRVIIIICITLA